MKIIINTQPNPEDNAMLQALYSRSPASVEEHLGKLAQTGSGKFMASYYLGYGHGSIGDCGFVTIYLEGISMLAAKAIEDNPLFNGQECSSRYIDFSNQSFYNPYSEHGEENDVTNLYAEYRKFYTESLPILKADLKVRFQKPEGEPESRYEKAIAARAFDILRGYLPASATTNVAWTTSLRTAQDRLIALAHHPLWEVRDLALKTFQELYSHYPNSFKEAYAKCSDFSEEGIEKFLIEIEGEEDYHYLSQIEHFYSDSESVKVGTPISLVSRTDALTAQISTEFSKIDDESISKARPKRRALPRHDPCTQEIWDISTLMDFGSFRDIQRHRNGYCSNPIIGIRYGFHHWYYDQLPEKLRARAFSLLTQIRKVYLKQSQFCDDDVGVIIPLYATAQYLLPMGMLVHVHMKYTTGQALYVAELRSGKTVHPTLRPFAQTLGWEMTKYGVPCNYDADPGDWTLKRGDQDIVQKS